MAKGRVLDGLVRWSNREEWRGALDEVLDDHFGDVCEDWDIALDFDELAELLGDNVAMSLWTCAFEDFLTRPAGETGQTMVDDYLARRGWKESTSNRRHMEALRHSAMSLYEVSDVVAGQSFLARDLLRGPDPVTVSEQAASRMLKPGDRIAARLIEVSGRIVLSGGLLMLERDLSEDLLEHLRGRIAPIAAELAAKATTPGADAAAIDPALAPTLALLEAAPLITATWLDRTLLGVLGDGEGDPLNRDGDPLVFHRVRFALREGIAAAQLRDRLRTVPHFREKAADHWIWIDAAEVMGEIRLSEDAIEAVVNSESRAGVVRALIHDAAADLLGRAEVSVETPAAETGDATAG